ncbi:MAG TPA: hypothetical protein VD790_00865 [Thermoleophilaceae bacterium]|nr:hypothetical protein [Thermoleophilaceae bacterium]
MTRRLTLALLALASLCAPAALAQEEEEPTKEDIVRESGPICSEMTDATRRHVRKFRRATRQGNANKLVRHGRRFVQTSRPYVRELGRLDPPFEGGRGAYLRFVNNTDLALDRLREYLRAVAHERPRKARRRARHSLTHVARAERSAEKYGLRRSCVKLLT